MLFKAHELATAMCPAGWTRVRLAEIAQEVSVRAGHDTALPVLSVTKHRGIVKAEDYFSKAVHGRDTSNYKIVRSGDFAYATIHLDEGSLGRHTDTPSGIVSPMYTVFEVTAGFDPYYLETLLRSPKSIVTYGSLGQGTVNRRASISFSAFSGLVLQHPPLPEQKKIAAILSSVDEVIAKTEAVIAQLQIVKKAMMEQLLTKGMPGRHTRFKQTEIGEIPEEWEVASVRDVAKSVVPGRNKPSVFDGTIPWLTIADLQHTVVTDSSAGLRVSQTELNNCGGKTVPAGTVIMSCVGRLGIVSISGCIVTMNQQLHGFACGPSIDPLFLCLVLRSAERQMQALAGKTTIPYLNKARCEEIVIPLPCLPEQRAVAEQIAPIETSLASEEAVLLQMRHLKSALSSSLLSGELRVIPEVAE